MTAIERLHRLVDDLPPERWPDAEERLRGLLDRDDVDWDAFRESRRHALPPGVTAEEIEADITVEMEEIRAERIARRGVEHAGRGR